MKSNPLQLCNYVELQNSYSLFGGYQLSRRSLLCKLSEHFGEDLLVLSGRGVASIIMFRNMAVDCHKMPVISDVDDDDALVDIIDKHTVQDSKEISLHKNVYYTRMNVDVATNESSYTLLSRISDNINSYLPNILIANIITSLVKHQPTSLQIGLGVCVRSKHIST